MQLEELERRYGLYVAETVRQSLTIEEFDRLEIEELVTYFSLRSARCQDEYATHRKQAFPENSPAATQDVYLDVLRRRWQRAEDLAHTVLVAQMDYQTRDRMKVVGI